MNRILFGGALGLLGMYFFDPEAGRRRRARTRNRVTHAVKAANEAGKVTARDAVHRAQGLVAETKRLFAAGPVTDEVLVERVRAALGRVVSHSHAIEVFVDRGHVDLSGPILADEVRPLLKCARSVPGVRAVSDHLTVYPEAGHVSALQGGRPRNGDALGSRFELLQDNWSPAARMLTGALGAGLMLRSTAANGLWGAALGAAGGALLARAIANRDLG